MQILIGLTLGIGCFALFLCLCLCSLTHKHTKQIEALATLLTRSLESTMKGLASVQNVNPEKVKQMIKDYMKDHSDA